MSVWRPLGRTGEYRPDLDERGPQDRDPVIEFTETPGRRQNATNDKRTSARTEKDNGSDRNR